MALATCPRCASETVVPDPDGGYTVCSSCGRDFYASDLLLQSPLRTRPRRRLMAPDMRPAVDECGFLSPESLSATYDVEALYELGAALVVAPPWSGKTFLAGQLEHHLGNTPSLGFGHVHRTDLEHCGPGTALRPSWWKEWRERGEKACWIVDAIDEDARKELGLTQQLLELLDDLGSSECGRLLLVVLSRESDIPDGLHKGLKCWALKTGKGESAFRGFRLAPPDPETARDMLRSWGCEDSAFDKVCRLIEANGLQPLASLPAALEALARQGEGAMLTKADVWRDVLTRLLCDRRSDTDIRQGVPSVEDRFRASCRMAAVLMFGGQPGIATEMAASREPRLAQVLGKAAAGLDHAARLALKGAVFERTATGYRFAQSHTQEWFTAFALDDVSLARLKPLVADKDGKPFGAYGGLLGILHQATQHEHVKSWILESFGGVPPRSDAAPWSLEDAVRALDRLQELARSVRGPLLSLDDRGLDRLATQGLDDVLVARLEDKAVSAAEKELLVDVAEAVVAKTTANIAAAIAKDGAEAEHLRLSAAYLLRRLGTAEHFLELEGFVESAEPATREQRALVSTIMVGLYENHVWGFAKAAKYAPEEEPRFIDATAGLFMRLKEDMTLEDARRLIRATDLKSLQPGASEEHQGRARYRRSGRKKLFFEAASKVASQDSPSAVDYGLLLPIAVVWHKIGAIRGRDLDFRAVFARDIEARRRLFAGGYELKLQGDNRGLHAWLFVLQTEDVDWLLEFCRKQQNDRFLLGRLLGLVDADGVSGEQRESVRRFIASVDSDFLDDTDEQRAEYERLRREDEEERARAEEDRKSEQVSIEPAVSNTLQHQTITPQNKLHRLSWLCFSDESLRPTNLVGQWGNLSGDLKAKVLEACHEGLADCKPTPIPTGSSFSTAILYEANAFRAVFEHSDTYELTGGQIRKWLPAALRLSSNMHDSILERCVQVDREATEDVLLGEMKREGSAGQEHMLVASNLPREYWSARLATEAAQLLDDSSLTIQAHSGLMLALARGAPESVLARAGAWAGSQEGEKDEVENRRVVGLDVLLSLSPAKALHLLAGRTAAELKVLLPKLKSLTDRHYGPVVDLGSWSAQMMESLANVLFLAVPPEEDPSWEPGGVRFLGPDHELRDLRNQIPFLLLKRGTEVDHEVLKRLSERHPVVKMWYERSLANQEALGLLESLPATGVHEQNVPVEKIAAALDNATYRLIRSSADLQAVLLEELAEIGKDAKQHLSLLYYSTSQKKRRTKRGKKPRAKTVRRHLHEEALQSYFHCRLNDRLPGRVLDEEARAVFLNLNREPLGAKNQRLDIRVDAPTVEDLVATVVVEIKWSDNRKEISTSLVRQLGEQYLVGLDLTHGIYLVGWCGPGSWSRHATGKAPKDRDAPDSWEEAFREQARLFAKDHQGVLIEPMVLDLVWDRRE